MAGTVLTVEVFHAEHGGFGCPFRSVAVFSGCGHHILNRYHYRAHEAGCIRCVHAAAFHLADVVEARPHDSHVRFDYRLTKPTKLLVILVQDRVLKIFFCDLVIFQERRDAEERAQEGVTLHTGLQVRSRGGLLGDLESVKDINLYVHIMHLLTIFPRYSLPGLVWLFIGFPYECTTFFQTVKRIGMQKNLRIATQHHIHMVQVAIYSDPFRCRHQEVVGGCSLLFRSVFGIRTNVNNFPEIPILVYDIIALGHGVREIAQDLTQVFSSGDHTPSADGMKPDGDGLFRQAGGDFK